MWYSEFLVDLETLAVESPVEMEAELAEIDDFLHLNCMQQFHT